MAGLVQLAEELAGTDRCVVSRATESHGVARTLRTQQGQNRCDRW